MEGDDQVAAGSAAAERADLDPAVSNGSAGYADLAGACALVADGQYVLRTHSVACDGYGDIARVEVGRVAVGHRGKGTCVQQHGAAAFGEGHGVAVEAADYGGCIGAANHDIVESVVHAVVGTGISKNDLVG